MSAYTLPTPPSGAVQNNGVLTHFIKQTVDNTPSLQSNGDIIYTEKWKGSYETAKELLSSIKSQTTLTSAHSAIPNKIEEFTPPACPSMTTSQGTSISGQWRVSEARIEQLQAGDHCNLTIKYYASYNTNSSTELLEDPEQDVWSISWQAYQVSPWDFCANEGSEPIVWSPSDTPPETPNWDTKADRSAIESALARGGEVKNQLYIVYTPDPKTPDVRKALCPANLAILKKSLLGRNATYHYPIVIHQTVKKGGIGSSYGSVGDGIDYKCDLPASCPFSLSGYEWVKIGDDMQQVKVSRTNSTTFTRREMFMGVAGEVDKNFYGDGAFTHTAEGIQNGRWQRQEI